MPSQLSPETTALLDELATRPLPFSVSVECTNRCTANCSFCGYGKGADPRPKGTLTSEIVEKLVRLLRGLPSSEKMVVSVGAVLGDPSAYPEWVELIVKLRAIPQVGAIRAYTNGLRLRQVGIDNILHSGLSVLNISTCLQNAEAYRRLYGVDCFEDMLEGLIELCEKNHRLGDPVSIDILLRMDEPHEDFFRSSAYQRLSPFLDRRNFKFLRI